MNFHLRIFIILLAAASATSANIYDVVSYGAKGDGNTDSTRGFEAAWAAACGTVGHVEVHVPSGTYAVGPVRFEGGACKSSGVTWRMEEGSRVVGPSDYDVVSKAFNWIGFHGVKGLSVIGGVIDARGQSLWECKQQAASGKRSCPAGGRSLSFDNCEKVVVEGLTSVNSQTFHVVVNGCSDVSMEGLKVRAHKDSPNTDGVHIEQSTDVSITYSSFQTGDDCISIGQGSRNIFIQHVSCGPGHGISIGSLGKSEEDEEVKNVTVKRARFWAATNGLRIKTWASPIKGMVQDVVFQDVSMDNVQNPIIIDQFYCPHSHSLSSQASGIKIYNVTYERVKGTSAMPVAVKFDCSPKNPCTGLTLEDVQLTYQGGKQVQSQCNNAFGKAIGPIQPSSCL